MNETLWYVAKPQGIDTALVYCHPDDGKIIIYTSVSEADKVAEDIGPGWQAELLTLRK